MLNLYSCKLTSLKGIHIGFAGGRLAELNLGLNSLETLPAELAQLAPSLRKLWLDDNR